MPTHGYRVKYALKWNGPKSAYAYQRFFRALYGYTQVVSKGNGRRYVYHRDGVLTRYPFYREGKNVVIIPDNALQPLLSFLRTGKNPAHEFQFTGQWAELVKYSIEEAFPDAQTAGAAVLDALTRIRVKVLGGSNAAVDMLQNVHMLTPEEAYLLYYAIQPTVSSNWFNTLSSLAPEIYSKVHELLSLL